MQLPQPWLCGIQEWAKRTDSICEVWLFGSRAHSQARIDSDVDLAIVLMPPSGRSDNALWKYFAHGDNWQSELAAIVGRHVSLEAIRPNTAKDAEIRSNGVLLWRRDGKQS